MIIDTPKTTEVDGEICVAANVRIESAAMHGADNVPETLWFRVPASYSRFISDRADAFVVAMILPAMLLGEDIVVEGPVSRRLAHGLREYVTAYAQWWPGRMSSIAVKYDEVSGPGHRDGGAVACAFSGGIDSMYSVWKHMPANETVPGFELTYALMVNGMNFDVDLDQTGEFQRLADVYRPMLARNGVELLTVRHNAQTFLEAVERTGRKSPTLEGQVVAAVHILGDLLERCYVSGSGTYKHEDNFPKGWHPSALHLLSNDGTELMFDGGDRTRTEKTVVLSDWADTYNTLRVCWRPVVFGADSGLIENCGRCPKCLRTMVTLEAAGKLGRYRTFPVPLTRSRIRDMHFVGTSEKKFYYDLLRLVRELGRDDLRRDLRYARFKSRLVAAVRARLLRRRVTTSGPYRPAT